MEEKASTKLCEALLEGRADFEQQGDVTSC